MHARVCARHVTTAHNRSSGRSLVVSPVVRVLTRLTRQRHVPATLLRSVLVASGDDDRVVTWLQQQRVMQTRGSDGDNDDDNDDKRHRMHTDACSSGSVRYVQRSRRTAARVHAMAEAALARATAAATHLSPPSPPPPPPTTTTTPPSITLLRSSSSSSSSWLYAARVRADSASRNDSTASLLPLPLTLSQLAAHVRAQQPQQPLSPQRRRLLLGHDAALLTASTRDSADAVYTSSARATAECATLLCAAQSHDLCIAELDDKADDDDDGDEDVYNGSGRRTSSRNDDEDNDGSAARLRLRARLYDSVTVATHVLRRDGALLLVCGSSSNSVSSDNVPAHATRARMTTTTATTSSGSRHAALPRPRQRPLPAPPSLLLSREAQRVLRSQFARVFVGVSRERDAVFALCCGAGAAGRAYSDVDAHDAPGRPSCHAQRVRAWSLRRRTANSNNNNSYSSKRTKQHARRRYASLRPRFIRAGVTGEALVADRQQRAAAAERDDDVAATFDGVAREMVYGGAYAHYRDD